MKDNDTISTAQEFARVSAEAPGTRRMQRLDIMG